MTTSLSISDQKNNEGVRLLTIFSAFFLPLTFIAGVYGMNFKIMPELDWKWGYYFSILLMAAVVIVIYIWFRRKRIL
jgi:magnesium transporter